MKLREIIDAIGVPRRTIYNWMDHHPNLNEQDRKSLLGHPFPKPIHKEGRENIWDEAAVHAWWDGNAKTIGRHPIESPTVLMSWGDYRRAMQRPPEHGVDETTGKEWVEDDMLKIKEVKQLSETEVLLTFRNASDAVAFRLKY